METLPPRTCPRLKHLDFRDPDDFAQSLNFSGRVTPLTLKPFVCNVTSIDLGDVVFHFSANERPMRVLGPRIPNRISFGFLLRNPDEAKTVSHYHPVSLNTMFGFDYHREINIVFLESVQHGYALIKPEAFWQYVALMGRDDINRRVLSHNLATIPATIEPLRAYLRDLYGLALRNAPCLTQPGFRQLIREDFIPLLIQAIPPGGQPQTEALRPFRRAGLVKQAEAFLQANLHRPLTLKTLTESLFTSKRSLMYGFEEMLGTTPMAYLKVLRLQAVHRALKGANAEVGKVSEIALSHGFYSMGHFSRDYKTLFGESPRETLKLS